MTIDFAGIARQAGEALRSEVGLRATLSRFEQVEGDWGSSPEFIASYEVDVMRTKFSQFERANSSIEVGDIKLLVAADSLAVAPETGDEIALDGKVYAVLAVEPFAPGAVPVYYTVHARGS